MFCAPEDSAGLLHLFQVLRAVQDGRMGRPADLGLTEENPDQGAGHRIEHGGRDEQGAKPILLLDDAGDERAYICTYGIPMVAKPKYYIQKPVVEIRTL